MIDTYNFKDQNGTLLFWGDRNLSRWCIPWDPVKPYVVQINVDESSRVNLCACFSR